MTSIWTGTDFRDVKVVTPCEFMFQTIRRSVLVVCVSVRATRLKSMNSGDLSYL